MKLITATDSTFKQKWQSLWDEQPFIHPREAHWGVEYQKEYYGPHRELVDLSFIVESEEHPVIGFFGHLEKSEMSLKLSSAGRPMVYLESSLKENQIPAAFKVFKDQFLKILKEHPSIECIYLDYIPDGSISRFSLFLLEHGARATPYFTQVVNLEKPESTLWSETRSSYKSLINWGIKELKPYVYDKSTIKKEHLALLRDLHVKAAGRETRSKKSWELQYEWVKNGHAFLVLGEQESVVVTGALFLVTNTFSFYGVGAFDRSISDKPLTHALIWKGLQHSKSMGCKTMEIGAQVFTVEQEGNIETQLLPYGERELQVVSQKNKNMSLFKRGFGGHTVCWLDLSLKIR